MPGGFYAMLLDLVEEQLLRIIHISGFWPVRVYGLYSARVSFASFSIARHQNDAIRQGFTLCFTNGGHRSIRDWFDRQRAIIGWLWGQFHSSQESLDIQDFVDATDIYKFYRWSLMEIRTQGSVGSAGQGAGNHQVFGLHGSFHLLIDSTWRENVRQLGKSNDLIVAFAPLIVLLRIVDSAGTLLHFFGQLWPAKCQVPLGGLPNHHWDAWWTWPIRFLVNFSFQMTANFLASRKMNIGCRCARSEIGWIGRNVPVMVTRYQIQPTEDVKWLIGFKSYLLRVQITRDRQTDRQIGIANCNGGVDLLQIDTLLLINYWLDMRS